jgi:agmatine deiminase
VNMTPAEAGFFMPSEWAAHSCCWIAWPCRENGFFDVEGARDESAQVAHELSRYEPVRLIATSRDLYEARRRCRTRPDGAPADVELVCMPADDSFTRDSGPTFLLDRHGTLGAVEWRCTSYGGLHRDYAETAKMAARIIELSGARGFAAPIALEGGAVHTDGQGTLLTTEDVVLDERRNPGLTRPDAEEVLRQYLGVQKVIWLAAALEDDKTGGHVDTLACFAGPGVVVALSCEDRDDPQFEPLRENVARLRAAVTASGRPLEVVTVDHPRRRLDDEDGHRLSASYVNFYIANGAVLVPGFGDPHDGPARETLARLFPGREVVQLPLVELARLAAGIHCITQQQPRVRG